MEGREDRGRNGFLLKYLLAVDRLLSVCLTGMVAAARLQFPGLGVVPLEQVNDVEQPPSNPGVQNRTGQLHSALCIPGHEVGRGDVQVRLLTPAELIDAAVF